MVKEILVKVGEKVLTNLQVFFGKREETESYLLRMNEPVYRFVEGTEENVVISSKGVILRRYPKSRRYSLRKDYYELVTPKVNNSGYLQIGGCSSKGNTMSVHRLVAETFLERPEGTTEVDHINQDKLDNRLENLRWVDHSGNMSNVFYRRVKATNKTTWKNITATDENTGETVTFSSFSALIPFAKGQGWGKGWGPYISNVLGKGGKAYGYRWTGTKCPMKENIENTISLP